MRMSIVTVTVERAEALLGNNPHNRRIMKNVVERYARDMAAGEWQVGAGAIVVGANGELFDGQHRLSACVLAGVPFQTVLYEDAEEAARDHIDENRPRGQHDRFERHGEVNSRNLAAAVRMGWLWKHHSPFERTQTPSGAESAHWLERNPSIREAVTDAYPFRKNLACAVSGMAPLIHQLRLVEPVLSAEFLTQVETGESLVHGDPALALRNWLLAQQLGSKQTARRALPAVYMHVWLKCWNAFVVERTLKLAKFVSTDPFPPVLDSDGRPAPMLDELDRLASRRAAALLPPITPTTIRRRNLA